MENKYGRNSANKNNNKFPQQDVYSGHSLGFGGAADDYSERAFDLNEQLVSNKTATYFLRMNGDAMAGAGIFSGDILIVDRSITNANGKVVIAMLNGEMMVRRLEKTINKIRLIPETTKLAVIDVDPFAEFAVWGVVVYAIHAV
jgi:DNA polymerase V